MAHVATDVHLMAKRRDPSHRSLQQSIGWPTKRDGVSWRRLAIALARNKHAAAAVEDKATGQ